MVRCDATTHRGSMPSQMFLGRGSASASAMTMRPCHVCLLSSPVSRLLSRSTLVQSVSLHLLLSSQQDHGNGLARRITWHRRHQTPSHPCSVVKLNWCAPIGPFPFACFVSFFIRFPFCVLPNRIQSNLWSGRLVDWYTSSAAVCRSPACYLLVLLCSVPQPAAPSTATRIAAAPAWWVAPRVACPNLSLFLKKNDIPTFTVLLPSL
jgi:hypothetical protein